METTTTKQTNNRMEKYGLWDNIKWLNIGLTE